MRDVSHGVQPAVEALYSVFRARFEMWTWRSIPADDRSDHAERKPDWPGNTQCSNCVEYTDKIRVLVGVAITTRAIGDAEMMCALLAQILERIALDRGAVLVDLLDGLGRDCADRVGVVVQWRAFFHVRGHTACSKHAAHATHGVRSAAEANEKYSVARSP